MLTIAYNTFFLFIYILFSSMLCLYQKYRFGERLRKEMYEGVKSLCIQLPLSNMAVSVVQFQDSTSLFDCFMYLFIYDFVVYVIHRIFHSNTWIYENFHRRHHETLYVTPFSSTILDIKEHVLIGVLPTLIPLQYISMTYASWVGMNLLIFLYGMLIHSTVCIEHASHHLYKNNHFGFINPLWDYLGGTLNYPITNVQLNDLVHEHY